MKRFKNIVIITIIFLSTIVNIMAQQESLPEIKAYILNMLQSEDYYDRNAVIGDATYMYNVPEVVPILEQTIWNQDKYLAYDYLVALNKYNSSNFTSMAHQFIDAVDTMSVIMNSFSLFSVLEMKVYTTDDLMDRGDFSTIQFVFELIESKKPGTFIGAANMLTKIIENVPQHESEAKAELIRLAQLNDRNESYNAVYWIIKHYGEETIPILVNVFINSTYRPEKAIALDALIKFGYQDLENLMRRRQITDSTMTTAIAEGLLEYYPSPYNYLFIGDNFGQISSGRQLTVSFLLQGFTPPVPDSSLSNIDLLENLIDLTDTVYNYTWLGDLQFEDELQSIIQSAKTNLQNQDSLACAFQVKAFQDLVDNVYKDSLNADPRFVTIEGWKFFYWNAQYILDRLPAIPIVVAVDIEVINPAMSLVNPGAFTMEVKGSGFSSSSTSYFNGNARATTFVSDSILNTQILSTDVSAAGNFPFWVSNGITNSDTLIYKVVSILPQPVRPVLECVTNNGDGTYTAFFGYKNENSISV
jgi:hypothetical protein